MCIFCELLITFNGYSYLHILKNPIKWANWAQLVMDFVGAHTGANWSELRHSRGRDSAETLGREDRCWVFPAVEKQTVNASCSCPESPHLTRGGPIRHPRDTSTDFQRSLAVRQLKPTLVQIHCSRV